MNVSDLPEAPQQQRSHESRRDSGCGEDTGKLVILVSIGTIHTTLAKNGGWPWERRTVPAHSNTRFEYEMSAQIRLRGLSFVQFHARHQ